MLYALAAAMSNWGSLHYWLNFIMVLIFDIATFLFMSALVMNLYVFFVESNTSVDSNYAFWLP